LTRFASRSKFHPWSKAGEGVCDRRIADHAGGFFVKTIEWVLKEIEDADSAPKLADAVKELAALGAATGDLSVVPHLIRALSYNNPGAAVASVDGLIAIGEPAVLPLLELLDGYNYSARAWALRALSGIGDPRSLSLLLDTAQNDFALSVRRAAARGLGTIRWEQMDTNAVPAAQAAVLDVLLGTLVDGEWVVRYSAISGIERMMTYAQSGETRAAAIESLSDVAERDEDLAVRSRAVLAIDRARN
jgi:phycocyanobilin lyase subunit beta